MDPYSLSQGNTSTTKSASIYGINFSAGRGTSVVNLIWHHPKEFEALSNDQKEKLRQWQETKEGKKVLDKSRKTDVDLNHKGEEDKKCDTKSKN